jgi:hypothetical protein
MFLTRLSAAPSDRSAGIYGVAILATAPAWFVHGRTMTGAIVPMACTAIVLAGLGIAVLDRTASTRARAAGLAFALAAAVISVIAARWGVPTRGLAVVVGIPTLAVGSSSVVWNRTHNVTAGVGVLAIGMAFVVAGFVSVIGSPDGSATTVLIGARAAGAPPTTFEAPVAAIAYGLVPWTPFVAFAVARRPTSVGHLAMMIADVLAIAAHALLAPRSGATTIVGVAFIAGAVAIMLRSLEDVQRPAMALVVSVLAIGALVAHDIGLAPERVFVAFGASDAAMPAAQAAASSLAIRSSQWLCIVLASFALISPRSWLPTGRGVAIIAAGVFAGLALRAHAYPELLARLSPGAAFDAWADRHRAGEPLGLVGLDRRTVAFAPSAAVVPHRDAPSAGRWLAEAPDPRARRFLAVPPSELSQVNAAYRAVQSRNVPVLAGRDGATLLAASALVPGEKSESPLDAIVLGAAPPSLRPLGAVLGDRLDAIGWQLVDDRGRAIDAVPRGTRTAHVRIFTGTRAGTAAAQLSGYCTFLHIDHSPSRFSAEHREHVYPMSLWRPGDIVVDDFDVKLPAHFRAGSYRIFWGVGVLPCEDDHRMHVTSGPSDGHDRIPAGMLEVR